MRSISFAITALLISVSNASKCPLRCECTGFVSGRYTVNCAGTNRTTVPSDIPNYTTDLILDNNIINRIGNKSFGAGLPNLATLSVRNNNLTWIESEALKSLTSLEILDLNNNSLQLNTSLPPTVFTSQSKSLKVLDIRRNLNNDNVTLVHYPIAIGSLKALTTLKMDCLTQKPLPKVYGQLHNLKQLIFGGGRSDAVRLATEMFDAVSELNVTEINLENLRLGYLNVTTLGKVKSLQILDLSNNPSIGYKLVGIIQGLKTTSIHTLRLNNTNMGDHATDIILQMGVLKLKELTMDNNNIYEIDSILSTVIPDIEVLSFGNNYIYERSSFVWDLYYLQKLVGLNISWQQKESSMVSKYRNVGIHICQEDTACPVRVPEKLLWLDMSHFGLHLPDIPELVILTNSTLKTIYVAYTGVQYLKKPFYCQTGPFHTHVQIETFDMRFNTIQCINKSVFDHTIAHCRWDTLKYLYLGSNRLGDVEGNICNEDKTEILTFLQPLTNLVVLDLSLNGLGSNLKYNDLSKLNDLEELYLSHNGLKKWLVDLDNMTHLELIDISVNDVPCLSKSTMRSLDKLQRQRTKPGSITINMTGNLLECSCRCIEFFQWLQKTKVNFLGQPNYECEFPDGKIWQLNRLGTIVAKLESDCYTTLWLDICIIVTILVYCMIFALTMMYRMRHEIKYMWIKLKMNREKLERLFSSKNYVHKFDAFVSCEHRDARLFVQRHLIPKLETENKGLTARWLKAGENRDGRPDMSFCVAQRDFVVGQAIIQNVVRCMKESRKVILVVSRYFLSSDWCKEEMRIAHQESLDRGKNIIICIFMPGVEQESLPGTIKMITRFVTCLQWPREEKARKVFWLMLQRAIMDGVQDENSFAEV